MPDIRNICSDKLINMGTEFGGEDFISTCGYRNVLSLKHGTKKLWKESVTEAAISSTNNQVRIYILWSVASRTRVVVDTRPLSKHCRPQELRAKSQAFLVSIERNWPSHSKLHNEPFTWQTNTSFPTKNFSLTSWPNL